MKTYVDANVLIRSYLGYPDGEGAPQVLRNPAGKRGWPFPVPDLLRCEVVNGVRRMVFESRHGGPWRVTPEIAACALADFREDLDAAVFLRPSPLSLADITPEFVSLSDRFTARHGFRTYDLLHVSSALTLGCRRFLSFDGKAKQLAGLAGLKTV